MQIHVQCYGMFLYNHFFFWGGGYKSFGEGHQNSVHGEDPKNARSCEEGVNNMIKWEGNSMCESQIVSGIFNTNYANWYK